MGNGNRAYRGRRRHIPERFDAGATPYQRVIDSPDVAEEAKNRLRETFFSSTRQT
jgi:hypothetical protein